jgi:hypothetical protein
MQVCSLPAAGEESVGTAARPGTFGVADCAMGVAIAMPIAMVVTEMNDKIFM